jgi:fructose-1,6-bisphosphatase I
VQGFTLDPNSGEFYLTHPDIRIPAKNSCYSTNEGNFKKLDEATRKAVQKLRDSYSLRYVGSLVADFHRNLLKGGIFLYPGDPGAPEGKLRLMYEANPLGFVTEQAGGAASSGAERILNIRPEKLHQRTPLILGNRDVVEETVKIMNPNAGEDYKQDLVKRGLMKEVKTSSRNRGLDRESVKVKGKSFLQQIIEDRR